MPVHHDPPSGPERHFQTAHLQRDLVGRTVRGGTVTMVAQGLKIVIQFATIIVLARLLSPDEFGLFAMVAALLAVLELFKDMGLSMATMQREDITHGQLSTLFWLNCALGLGVALLTAALAPLIAWFYGEPQLLEITPVVAIAFLFTGLAAQHLALLRRQMRFTIFAAIQLASEVAGLMAAIVSAWAGFGVWALVIQRLAWATVLAVGGWVACGWRPSRPGPLREVRHLAAFGANATGAMVIGALASNMDKVLIGWYWGVGALGLFERAQKLVHQPIQNLNGPLAGVAMPALSRIADQPERYRRFYLGMILRLSMVLAPAAAVAVAGSEPLVRVVLGAEWLPAAPIFAWLGVAAVTMPATYSLSWLYVSQDRTGEMLRAGVVNGGLAIASVLAGLPFGVTGVAMAFALGQVMVRGPLMFWLAGRRGPVRANDFFCVLAAPAAAAAAGAGSILLTRDFAVLDGQPLVATVAWYGIIAFVAALAVYAVAPGSRKAVSDIARSPAHFFRKAVRT